MLDEYLRNDKLVEKNDEYEVLTKTPETGDYEVDLKEPGKKLKDDYMGECCN